MDHQFSRAEAWHFSDVWPILLPSALIYDIQRKGSVYVILYGHDTLHIGEIIRITR
jgi:hypothetical protein